MLQQEFAQLLSFGNEHSVPRTLHTRVGVRAVSQQELHHFPIPSFGGSVQSSAALCIEFAPVRIGATLEQQAHNVVVLKLYSGGEGPASVRAEITDSSGVPPARRNGSSRFT